MSVLRRMISPFNITALAVECLAEAWAERELVEAYVKQVCSTREWLRRELERMGFQCWPSYTNFLLANFGKLRPEVLRSMAERGVALRDRPDCDGCIRISIGTQQEMERVVATLREIVAEKPTAGQVMG